MSQTISQKTGFFNTLLAYSAWIWGEVFVAGIVILWAFGYHFGLLNPLGIFIIVQALSVIGRMATADISRPHESRGLEPLTRYLRKVRKYNLACTGLAIGLALCGLFYRDWTPSGAVLGLETNNGKLVQMVLPDQDLMKAPHLDSKLAWYDMGQVCIHRDNVMISNLLGGVNVCVDLQPNYGVITKKALDKTPAEYGADIRGQINAVLDAGLPGMSHSNDASPLLNALRSVKNDLYLVDKPKLSPQPDPIE